MSGFPPTTFFRIFFLDIFFLAYHWLDKMASWMEDGIQQWIWRGR